MQMSFATKIVSGPASLRPYGRGQDVLDVIRDEDAPVEARVLVRLAGSIRRLRIPDGRMSLLLEVPAEQTVSPISIILPGDEAIALRELTLVNVRASIQGWPDVLHLQDSEVMEMGTADGGLAELHVSGQVLLKATTMVHELATTHSGEIRLDGEIRANHIRGPRLSIAPANDGACLVATATLSERMEICIAAKAELLIAAPMAAAVVVDHPQLSGDGTVTVQSVELLHPRLTGGLQLHVVQQARLTEVSGQVASLSAARGCAVQGDASVGFAVGVVNSAEGAEFSGIDAFRLTRSSLAIINEAAFASFWTGTSISDGAARARAMGKTMDARYLNAYWAALLQIVEKHGTIGRARLVARRAEMDFRRRALPLLSGDRLALELMRPIRYGQSVVAPLAAQVLVSVLGVLVLRSTHGLVSSTCRNTAIAAARLFLAPLGVTSQLRTFQPDGTPGVWDTAVWLVCVLSGFFFFSAAALAVRRRITYT
jgi:hypothetical protein